MSNRLEDFAGLKVIDAKTFSDSRGYFRETYRDVTFETLTGRKCIFLQDNEAYSKPKFVLRGLHFQKKPKAQAKLVRVVKGSIYDVVVDLRCESSSYGKWLGVEISAENGKSIFVPEGFAHGYLTLEEDTIVTYKVSDYYAPETEGGILWNDPEIGIQWPLSNNKPIISDKDMVLPPLSQLDLAF